MHQWSSTINEQYGAPVTQYKMTEKSSRRGIRFCPSSMKPLLSSLSFWFPFYNLWPLLFLCFITNTTKCRLIFSTVLWAFIFSFKRVKRFIRNVSLLTRVHSHLPDSWFMPTRHPSWKRPHTLSISQYQRLSPGPSHVDRRGVVMMAPSSLAVVGRFGARILSN